MQCCVVGTHVSAVLQAGYHDASTAYGGHGATQDYKRQRF